jgi:Phosphoribosylglycinamide synthetase, ATP-grasp (A) domain
VSVRQPATRKIVLVSRYLAGESLRVARAIKQLDGVELFGVCEDVPGADAVPLFTDLIRLGDTHDPEQLIAAARGLADKHGRVERMVTATETLLHPVAEANETLGLQGMSVATVRRALDKSCLKATLERAGINTARDQLLTSSEEARRFAAEVGFPIVLKPLGGSGALATLCIRSADELELALDLMQPTATNAVLAEVYLSGQELCIDTITVADEPQFYSICRYRPSILEAVEDPRIQWTCVMPRDMTGDLYQEFIAQGLKAVRALSVGNAMTHMEGFLTEAGKPCFTDATLRPAGARIGPMLAFAYDINPYFAWARVAVDGCFDGPWERQYAVGTVFLRGTGAGRVEHVEGVESVSRHVGNLLVESRLPRVGATRSATYTGDGYITVRHPDTGVVEEALDWIAQTVRITYTQPEFNLPPALGGQWSQRLQCFDKQLNKPAWDDDSLPTLNHA